MSDDSPITECEVSEETAVFITDSSQPVTGWMVGRIVEWQTDDDGLPESMRPLMLVMLSTHAPHEHDEPCAEASVIARFDMDTFREFTNDCIARLARHDAGPDAPSEEPTNG